MYLLANIQVALLVLLMSLIASPSSSTTNTTNINFYNAIKDMQNASYFSFVMLINMYPIEKFPKNVTFFMPSDRSLSQTSLSEKMLLHFLLQHSIPSPMHFDNLALLPTGSVIPTSQPGYNLRVSNYGKKSFYLNRIQISSPNICTSSESSIRCHGISGVLSSVRNRSNAPGMMPRRSSAAPLLLPLKNVVPMPAPAPFGALKSDGPPSLKFGMRVLLKFIATKFVVFTVFGPF